MKSLIAACLLASPAAAEDITFKAWSPTAYVEIQSGAEQGVWAIVTFKNDTFHRREIETFPLILDGHIVSIRIDTIVGPEPERMTVKPPPGFLAEPTSVIVEEGGERTVLIYQFLG